MLELSYLPYIWAKNYTKYRQFGHLGNDTDEGPVINSVIGSSRRITGKRRAVTVSRNNDYTKSGNVSNANRINLYRR